MEAVLVGCGANSLLGQPPHHRLEAAAAQSEGFNQLWLNEALSDKELREIVASWESAEGDPAARAALVQAAIDWPFAASGRKRAQEKPLKEAWLAACLVPGLRPESLDEEQFRYSVRELARRPVVARSLAAIPDPLPALPRAERFRPAETRGQPARLREALLAEGSLRLEVSVAEFTDEGLPDLGSEGRLLPTWHLSWYEDAMWPYGIDWDDFGGYIFDLLEVEAGVVYADAGDSGWLRIGLDHAKPADEVLAVFLRSGITAYRRAAEAVGIQCP